MDATGLFEKAAPALTYGGGSVTIMSGISAEWVGILIGALGMVIGVVLTWYYKRREDERNQFYRVREDARQQSLFDLQMILRTDRHDKMGDHQSITEEVVAMEAKAEETACEVATQLKVVEGGSGK